MRNHTRSILVAVFALRPIVALGGDPTAAPKSFVEKNRARTIPLESGEAGFVGELEQTIKHIDENQQKLKTGKMRQEDFDKDLAKTKQLIAETAAKNPESSPIQTSAARAYIQAGDYGKAAAHATQAMALKPGDPFPVLTRGIAHFNAKDYPKAADDARETLRLDPENPAAKALWLLSKDRAAGGTIVDASRPRLRHIMDTVVLPPNPYVSELVARAGPDAPSGQLPGRGPEGARDKIDEARAYLRRVDAAQKAAFGGDYLTAWPTTP